MKPFVMGVLLFAVYVIGHLEGASTKTEVQLVNVKVIGVNHVGNYLHEKTTLERLDTHQRINVEGNLGQEGDIFSMSTSEMPD